MSATQKVPATFGVWATYEEFQKGNIPDEVFGKDEYNLAVDYAQGLSKGSKPAMLAINTTYRGKRNDFARMVAASRSEYDGSWRPYARVFVTSGVWEISDERAAANQRARNKYAGITNRKMPLVNEPEQPTLFDAVEDENGKYYPPVEMEMTDDLMAIGDNDQPDGPKEFGHRIVRDTGDYDDPSVGELRKIIAELRSRNLQLAMKLSQAEQKSEVVSVHMLVDVLRQVAHDLETGR